MSFMVTFVSRLTSKEPPFETLVILWSAKRLKLVVHYSTSEGRSLVWRHGDDDDSDDGDDDNNDDTDNDDDDDDTEMGSN